MFGGAGMSGCSGIGLLAIKVWGCWNVRVSECLEVSGSWVMTKNGVAGIISYWGVGVFGGWGAALLGVLA